MAQLRKIAGFEGNVACVAFSPDRKSIAAGNTASVVLCWAFSEKTFVIGPKPHPSEVTSLVFTPKSTCIVLGQTMGPFEAGM